MGINEEMILEIYTPTCRLCDVVDMFNLRSNLFFFCEVACVVYHSHAIHVLHFDSVGILHFDSVSIHTN